MNIITLLLNLTILITIYFGSYKLFYNFHKKINDQYRIFEIKTKNYHLTTRGSITLMGPLVITSLLSFLILSLSILKNDFNKNKKRKESYLCFIYKDNLYRKYFKEMVMHNQLIAATYAAQLIPAATTGAKIAYETAKKIRDISNIKYVKNFIKNKYCTSSNPIFLMNLPFKTIYNYKLKENAIGLSELSSTDKIFIIQDSIDSGPVIKVQYSFKSNLIQNITSNSWEIYEK